MANVTIGITFEYDPDEAQGMPLNNFLYHFLNRFNARFPIRAIDYGGKKRMIGQDENLATLPLRKVDSIDEKDRPVKKKVMFDILPPRETNKVRPVNPTKLNF